MNTMYKIGQLLYTSNGTNLGYVREIRITKDGVIYNFVLDGKWFMEYSITAESPNKTIILTNSDVEALTVIFGESSCSSFDDYLESLDGCESYTKEKIGDICYRVYTALLAAK